MTGNGELHAAAVAGNFDAIKSLVETKADVNYVDPESGDTALIALIRAHGLSFKSMMAVEYLVKSGKADVSIGSQKDGKKPVEIASESLPESKRNDPLIAGVLALLEQRDTTPTATPTSPSAISPRPKLVERSDALRKILNTHIPDVRKPVPYRETAAPLSPTQLHNPAPVLSPRQVVRPVTPPKHAEDEKKFVGELASLRAENEALRAEIDRLRSLIHKISPEEQLKVMHARLIQLEAIESQLNSIAPT